MKLHNPDPLFGLDEKIYRRLTRVRLLRLIRETIWKLAKMYRFINQEIIFEQYMVMNGDPV